MNRAAIIATTVASILPFSSFSFAASDAELSQLGDLMSGAFRCSTYASTFHDQNEQARLFQIGLKAGRDFVEGTKSRNEPPLSELPTYMPGASTDFLVGTMYASDYKTAYDEIGKGLFGQSDPEARVQAARLIYRTSNCSLIK